MRRKYLRTFESGGQAALFERKTNSTRKFDDEEIKQAVFRLLHEPPSNYGINRTTWIMPDLARVLRETGHPACPEVIRKITKAAGYRWRKARVVLTSSDPNYTEKLNHILSGLRPDEAFFSIDEFGPFAIKMKPGLALCAPGEQRVVPQWQKSRGCLIMTAALELSGNQATHFYSPRKNTVDDPHDGASGREVPRPAEALSLLGRGLVAYCEASASARSGAQLHCTQRRWANGRDRSTAVGSSIPQCDPVRLQRLGTLHHSQQRLQDTRRCESGNRPLLCRPE